MPVESIARDVPPSRRMAPPIWAWPAILFIPLEAWRELLARQLPAQLDAAGWSGSLGSDVLVWIGVGVVVFDALAEALVYGVLWSARGCRLPFLPTAVAALQLSLFEPIAQRLLDTIPADSGGALPLALLVGPRALWPSRLAPDAWSAAFAAVGLFMVARIALFAALQSATIRRPFLETVALVGSVWFLSHLGLGFILELISGRGPLR